MKRLCIILLIIANYGCKEAPENLIAHLNGYWEIKKVTSANGTVHDYKYNTFIDYFEVTDSLTGFRKKLKPLLDGTFETTQDAEQFMLKIENDSLNIYYKTPFSNWKETIISATDQELKIINANKDLFLYKPFKPEN